MEFQKFIDHDSYFQESCLKDIIKTLAVNTEVWEYNNRRIMQEIVPGVFLGPYSAAAKSQLNNLKSTGITHIVCVRDSLEAPFIKPNFEDHFKYFVLEIRDSSYENILKSFSSIQKFIDEAMSQGGKVLIHGNTGTSRSAALVIAYIMEKYSIGWMKAYEFVLQKRLCIKPNEGFMTQLENFEKICQAQQQINNSSPLPQKGQKRRYDEI